MIPIKFSRPLDFNPINTIEPTADMVGSRYYNKATIYDPTDPSVILFEKAWYECTDNGESASPRYTWAKVNEGGGDITIDPDGGLVKATNGLKINDNAVTESRLANDSVTTNKIADSQVTTDKLASDSVTTVKVIDDAITTAKIADGAITTAKVVDKAITTAKINPSTTNGQVLITKNGATSWETPTAVDGVTISDSGNIHLTGEIPTIESGTNIQFGKDANGKWGYKVGADAVVPFKNPTGTLEITNSLMATEIDVEDYKKATFSLSGLKGKTNNLSATAFSYNCNLAILSGFTSNPSLTITNNGTKDILVNTSTGMTTTAVTVQPGGSTTSTNLYPCIIYQVDFGVMTLAVKNGSNDGRFTHVSFV